MTEVIFETNISERSFDKNLKEFTINAVLPFNRFPNVDVVDSEKSIELTAELPGVNKEDVKILLEDGFLTVSGEKKNEFEDNEEINFIEKERSFGKFERKFKLAENINQDEIKAIFENGLLKISIAKLAPVKPNEKIIEVN